MRSLDKEKKERETPTTCTCVWGLLEDSTTRVRMNELGGHRTAELFNYKRVIIVRRRNRLRLGIFHTVVGDALLAAVWAIAKSMNLKVDINDHAAPNLCFEDASGKIRHLS